MMDKITCVIVDDEPRGVKTLSSFISKYAPELELIGTAHNVSKGVSLIRQVSPKLVFLDVEMPDGTGFNLLEKLGHTPFKLIFVTAFQEYAVKAFNLSAIDYLLKPLNPELFRKAVQKSVDSARIDDISLKLEVLLNNSKRINKIALPSSTGIQFAKIEDIIRCESDNNYTFIHLQNGKKVLVTKTLKEFETMLTEHGFYRTHNSHIVNIALVSKYVRGEGGWVVLENGEEIEVSRRRKEGLLSAMTFK